MLNGDISNTKIKILNGLNSAFYNNILGSNRLPHSSWIHKKLEDGIT